MRARSARYFATLYLLYGVSVASLGAAWPSYRGDLGAPSYVLGVFVSASAVGRCVGPVLLTRRARAAAVRRSHLVAIQVFGAAALLLADVVTDWRAIACLLLLVGAGMGCLDLASTAAILKRSSPKLLFRVNGYFALGTVAGPGLVIVARSLGLDWLGARAVPFLIPGLVLLVLADLFPSEGQIELASDAAGPRQSERTFARGWVLITVVAGAETALGAWVSTFFDANHNAGVGESAALVFWCAFAASRLISARVARIYMRPRILVPILLVLPVLITAAVFADPPSLAVALFALGGAFLGPAYPILVAQRAPQGQLAEISQAIVVSTVGSILMPLAVGTTWVLSSQLSLVACAASPAIVLAVSMRRTRCQMGDSCLKA